MGATRFPAAATRLLVALLAALSIAVLAASPAVAHKNHKTETEAAQVEGGSTHPAAPVSSQDKTAHASAVQADPAQAPPPSLASRLVDWFGRIHPAIVHFPIAFFPAALFTAVVGRRRPAFAAPVQFLVVAGGIFAPIAALAGWIAGSGTDPGPIIDYHRWLGVVTGLFGAGLAAWAWKRPWEDRGAGMILALTVMTAVIAVQAFLGAAVTHGIDHLML